MTALEYIEIVKAVNQPNCTVVNKIIPSSPLMNKEAREQNVKGTSKVDFEIISHTLV